MFRPIAEELQWLPEEVYLGISGKQVKPDLYIGLGVSGQIQHVSGIRDSKVIFAINRDENAPIFEAADYGIVGDLYQIVPQLIQELKAALGPDGVAIWRMTGLPRLSLGQVRPEVPRPTCSQRKDLKSSSSKKGRLRAPRTCSVDGCIHMPSTGSSPTFGNRRRLTSGLP